MKERRNLQVVLERDHLKEAAHRTAVHTLINVGRDLRKVAAGQGEEVDANEKVAGGDEHQTEEGHRDEGQPEEADGGAGHGVDGGQHHGDGAAAEGDKDAGGELDVAGLPAVGRLHEEPLVEGHKGDGGRQQRPEDVVGDRQADGLTPTLAAHCQQAGGGAGATSTSTTSSTSIGRSGAARLQRGRLFGARVHGWLIS